MTLILLGTGTSTGVPEVGCGCITCQSHDARDKRLRTSALLVTNSGRRILIDCGPDFRQQANHLGLDRVDAILLTHEHYDHVYGLDDLRTIAWRDEIPIYGQANVLEAVRGRMHYVFREKPYPGTARFSLHELSLEGVELWDELRVEPILVWHGKLPIYGYRFHELGQGREADISYITDMKSAEPREWAKVDGSSLLVVNALRYRKEHPSHQSVIDVEPLLAELENSPRLTVLTHLSHHAPRHEALQSMLPEGMAVGYDYMCLSPMAGSVWVEPYRPMAEPYEAIDLPECVPSDVVEQGLRTILMQDLEKYAKAGESRLLLRVSEGEECLFALLHLDREQYPISKGELELALGEARASLLAMYPSIDKEHSELCLIEQVGETAEDYSYLIRLQVHGAGSLHELSKSGVRLDMAVVKAQLSACIHRSIKGLMASAFKSNILLA